MMTHSYNRKLGLFFGALLLSVVSGLAEPVPMGMARVEKGIYRPAFRGTADPKGIIIKAFALDILPVTNGEFLEFVRKNPRWQRSRIQETAAEKSYLGNWAGDLELGTNALRGAPVTFVSFFAANAYAGWKGKRLPTIAEWEYAALASPTQMDGQNDTAFKRQIVEWYSSPSTKLGSVGKGKANYWGLHDLHGLAWEWVSDFDSALAPIERAGVAKGSRDLFCGAGSQNAADRGDFPAFMRFGFRSSLKANYTVHNLGFRCAMDLGQ